MALTPEVCGKLYTTLKLIQKGIQKGHIKDQTIITLRSPEKIDLQALSEMVDEILMEADAPRRQG